MPHRAEAGPGARPPPPAPRPGSCPPARTRAPSPLSPTPPPPSPHTHARSPPRRAGAGGRAGSGAPGAGRRGPPHLPQPCRLPFPPVQDAGPPGTRTPLAQPGRVCTRPLEALEAVWRRAASGTAVGGAAEVARRERTWEGGRARRLGREGRGAAAGARRGGGGGRGLLRRRGAGRHAADLRDQEGEAPATYHRGGGRPADRRGDTCALCNGAGGCCVQSAASDMSRRCHQPRSLLYCQPSLSEASSSHLVYLVEGGGLSRAGWCAGSMRRSGSWTSS